MSDTYSKAGRQGCPFPYKCSERRDDVGYVFESRETRMSLSMSTRANVIVVQRLLHTLAPALPFVGPISRSLSCCLYALGFVPKQRTCQDRRIGKLSLELHCIGFIDPSMS